ncbi:hypothetical protein [Paenibacillus elgii]|uniref:hypothetical protein n=1 Tax=Paenibacillus elgii TaxID=189691 RepID=UPI000248C2FF|nr:hypothetical protein [Paenibacillus elgii]
MVNKLVEKVINRLSEKEFQHEIIGNVIHTRLCTIEVWGWEITVNEKSVKLEEMIAEVMRHEQPA